MPASGSNSASRRFATEVRFHVAVEIEVIAGQVREDRGGKMQVDRPGAASSACDETSMTQAPQPSVTISRSIRCRSGASGVVRAASTSRLPIR